MMAIIVGGGLDVPARDGTLVLGVCKGDRAAFAELYDRRARLVRAVCYDETRDSSAAADLTQEVFLRAYKNLNHLHEPDRFAAWLVGVARQDCREWWRGRCGGGGRADRVENRRGPTNIRITILARSGSSGGSFGVDGSMTGGCL